jgi:hypothetical protein
MAPTERTAVVTVRLSDDEKAMLERLAEVDGFSASDVLRQLLRREYVVRWPPKVKTKR